MEPGQEQILKNITRQLIIFQLLSWPALAMLALGLYGMFGAQGDAFHPWLNDISNVQSLLVVGAVIEVFCLFKIIPLGLKRHALTAQKDTWRSY